MKTTSIAKSLGMKQREMAQILGVHPSLYSMFECGKRTLPLAAMQLLSELLQCNEQSAPADQTNGKTNQQVQNEIQRLLRENEYQRLALHKQYEKTKQQAALIRKRNLIDAHLQNRGALHPFSKVQPYKVTTPALLETTILRMELKLEALEREHLHLRSKMSTLKNTLS